MEDKKQDVKSLEELVKTADSYRAFFANLADELSKVLADIQVSKKEEDTWEMKCPYKLKDEYWLIYSDGVIGSTFWFDRSTDKGIFDIGNAFQTEEAALLESKRRNLLTRFRAFRDECNGDWKPDWNDINQDKYVIKLEEKKDFYIALFWTVNEFNLFGYFKNQKGAQRAIELFGDEIKALFVDCEV